ncbi:MAG TPA: DNA-3-methyladenine glycosylase 2 family protein [Kineosporiaceae bacterium]|nr:DNA-3-methyladenine glycosylase 2 family protein [Kineosporiaceae bacterium]
MGRVGFGEDDVGDGPVTGLPAPRPEGVAAHDVVRVPDVDLRAAGVPGHRRVWRPAWPVDPHLILACLQRGTVDPAYRREPDGTVWRATRTPDGPVLLRLTARPSAGEVVADAWGPGADHALDGVPTLLGADDDPAGFRPLPGHPRLVAAWQARPHWRVTRTRAVFEALATAVLEQRVTGLESRRSWRLLVTAYGEPAPGPGRDVSSPALGMRVPPSPQEWAAIPSWDWLRAGVEESRHRVVVAAAAVSGRLEATTDLPADRAAATLRAVPGVGVWTAAEVRQRAHGDPDAISWSDYHVAADVSWALTGEVLDDVACAEVVEPYRGHRYRVQRLLELAGVGRPRRAPRMTLPRHLPGDRPGRAAR